MICELYLNKGVGGIKDREHVCVAHCRILSGCQAHRRYSVSTWGLLVNNMALRSSCRDSAVSPGPD